MFSFTPVKAICPVVHTQPSVRLHNTPKADRRIASSSAAIALFLASAPLTELTSDYLNSIFYNGEYRVQVAYDIANKFNILSKLPKATPFIAIFKHHLLGWGSWTRTSEYRSQSPVPYRLGDTPILVGTWGFEPETVRL